MTTEEKLGTQYTEHIVFNQLKVLAEFYESVSYLIMGRMTPGIASIVDLDTHVFSSMHGTLESIYHVLMKGRINDAYTLLRKYFDSTVINVYTNLYLEDHFGIDNWIVSKIYNWIKGTETLPEFRVISKYIKDSVKLEPITKLLMKDDRYKKIRARCNDHTHYNYFYNVLMNDNELHLDTRINTLDIILNDLNNIFIQHFAYIFYLKEYYMSSSDYVDSLDVGIQPIESSQYWVAPFIQTIFTDLIKSKRQDIACVIKDKTCMELE